MSMYFSATHLVGQQELAGLGSTQALLQAGGQEQEVPSGAEEEVQLVHKEN